MSGIAWFRRQAGAGPQCFGGLSAERAIGTLTANPIPLGIGLKSPGQHQVHCQAAPRAIGVFIRADAVPIKGTFRVKAFPAAWALSAVASQGKVLGHVTFLGDVHGNSCQDEVEAWLKWE